MKIGDGNPKNDGFVKSPRTRRDEILSADILECFEELNFVPNPAVVGLLGVRWALETTFTQGASAG